MQKLPSFWGFELKEKKMEMDNKNMIELAEKYGEAMTKKYGSMNSAAIGCVTPNILVGANWAFLTPNEGRELKNAFDKEGDSGKIFEMIDIRGGGKLLIMTFDKVIEVLSGIPMQLGIVNKADVEAGVAHRNESAQAFEKLLVKGYSGTIGIMNLNDSNTITIKGKRFPSFAIDMTTLLEKCNKYGYSVILGGVARPLQTVYDKRWEVIKNLELAPSGNAMLIEIKQNK